MINLEVYFVFKENTGRAVKTHLSNVVRLVAIVEERGIASAVVRESFGVYWLPIAAVTNYHKGVVPLRKGKKKTRMENSPAVQWLGLHAFTSNPWSGN